MVIEYFGEVDKPGVGFKFSTLNVAVTSGLGSQESCGPAGFTQTGGKGDGLLLVTIVTQAVIYGSAPFGVGRPCHYVDGTTNGWGGNLGSTKTALHLHAFGYIGETGPV